LQPPVLEFSAAWDVRPALSRNAYDRALADVLVGPGGTRVGGQQWVKPTPKGPILRHTHMSSGTAASTAFPSASPGIFCVTYSKSSRAVRLDPNASPRRAGCA